MSRNNSKLSRFRSVTLLAFLLLILGSLPVFFVNCGPSFEVLTDHQETSTGEPEPNEVDFTSDDGELRVYGSIFQGNQLTLMGNGFGDGPDIVLYDDFDGGQTGKEIPLTSPRIGKWTYSTAQKGTYRPRFHSYAYSGTHSYSMSDDVSNPTLKDRKMAQLQVEFSNSQEVFLSFQVAVPPGKNFSGSSSRNVFSTGSHWKLTWLIDTPGGYGHQDGLADLCVPTNGQAQGFQIAGNSDQIGPVAKLTTDFDMNGFNRLSTWLKADPNNLKGSGYVWFQIANRKLGQPKVTEYNKPVFNAAATSTRWNTLNVPGWYGNGNQENTGGVYDDIYFARGPNAAARVEVCDAPVYTSCKDISIMPSLRWTNSEIEVLVKYKGRDSISGRYLYVFNKKNEILHNGVKIP